MHSLYDREDPIPTLYVKDAPFTYNIRQVFTQARALAPCMLVLEDVETIVTPETRSYFFNEMDGLENNDGLFIVASTNFLDKLDPGLSNRPSRFDRKYLFPIPNEHERTLYCEFWRNKLKSNKSVYFPEKLCSPMAHITPGFSFAFLQECFVATLLVLATDVDHTAESIARPYDDDNDDLDDYELWVAFRKQADILRKEIDNQAQAPVPPQLPRTAHAHCHCCSGHSSREWTDSATGAMEALHVKDEVLPGLPYSARKQRVINSAAFALE